MVDVYVSIQVFHGASDKLHATILVEEAKSTGQQLQTVSCTVFQRNREA